MLEAGRSDWHPYIHIPAGFIKTFHMTSVNWLYQQEPSAWTGGRRIFAPRGKTLGGSRSINGHIYNRGQRQDFDTWAQIGNRGWGYADVLPYFSGWSGASATATTTFRGRDGNLTVTDIDWRHPLCEAFIEGAVSLGIPRNPDYNGAIQEGVTYAQRTIQNGRRVSAATAFLHPAASGRTRTSAPTRTPPTSCSRASGRSACAIARAAGAARRSRCAPARGDPVGRHLQFAAAAAALGHRPAGAAAVARHRGAARAAGVGENLRDHYAPRFVARVKNIETINERGAA